MCNQLGVDEDKSLLELPGQSFIMPRCDLTWGIKTLVRGRTGHITIVGYITVDSTPSSILKRVANHADNLNCLLLVARY